MIPIERLATRSERIKACELKERGYMPDTNEMIDDMVNVTNDIVNQLNEVTANVSTIAKILDKLTRTHSK